MAQILVLTESSDADGVVIYSESVGSVHLEGHAGNQLVERLRWAVSDAQVAEHRALLRMATVSDAERPAAA
jgi:hypothetical protein